MQHDRRAEILECPEAQGREQLAAHLADHTTMAVDEAKIALSKAGTLFDEPGRAKANMLRLVGGTSRQEPSLVPEAPGAAANMRRLLRSKRPESAR